MSDERTELPTAEHIQELREKGIVSYSSRSGAFLIAIGLTLFFLGKNLSLEKLQFTLMGVVAGQDLRASGAEIGLLLKKGLLIPAAIVVSIALVWGLAQTRFLIHPGLIVPNFARLRPRANFRLGGLFAALFTNLILGLFAVGGLLVIWKFVLVRLFVVLRYGNELQLLEQLIHGLRADAPLFVLLFAFISLLLLLTEKLRFSLMHRMTRKDVQNETR